jgi:uncharacterized protein YkwD
MNWWLLFQLGQWLAQLDSPPEQYLLSDQAFFAQPAVHQLMPLEGPDTLLLDIALFQATNEARRQADLAPLQYDRSLLQAAQRHAESMIEHGFVSHDDVFQLSQMTLSRRVTQYTRRFGLLAENIGQYQTIETAKQYGVRFNASSQRYEYIDLASHQLYLPYSYGQYARYAVEQWLHSAHHRANLLSPMFTHVGCAGRLSAYPYRQREAPYGRVIQNFGMLSSPTQISQH